ncbi:PDZ domain-containing protein 8 [Clupea harengus]|uniref:PDZ domain-containing protein 8 n=1 Tax=Clupea harengus TaxID=7950 RepID=A0A6P8GH04_CLUHA|nr:PDZ domain-containing protein 8 [Clupea harengus]
MWSVCHHLTVCVCVCVCVLQTEVVKGPSGSWGMTFRHVAASEGDAVHVSIERVTPNSPAAQADLQRGDRLIAIGGVKVTSSVQVPKLLKQSGERVQVLYERPVRHQAPSAGIATPQDALVSLDEPAPLPPPPPTGYEEDPAPITTMDISESKDNDSEFEELVVESRPPQPPTPTSTPSFAGMEVREDFLLSVNQSPKKTVATLASKPLGSISPILNRKLNLGLQSPLKPQPKESPKPSPSHKATPEAPAGGGEGPQRPTVPPPPPPARPPVPPRPHIKVTSVPEAQSQTDSADGTPAAEKSPEKTPPAAGTTGGNGDKTAAEKSPVKLPEPKPLTKPPEPTQDTASMTSSGSKSDLSKDKNSDQAGSSTNRDSLDEQGLWESSECMYRKRLAHWSKASVVFEVESQHRFLNVALWCKDPFKLGSLLCLGHVTLHLEHVALECLSTSSGEYQSTFRLNAPEPRASVSRTALRSLTTHKGFNEKLCYGDVTLNFTYLVEGEPEHPCGGGVAEGEREGSLQEEEPHERERTEQLHPHPVMVRDELSHDSMAMGEVRHNFQDTQFQNPTWCEYCKRKVWTKAASQCIVCDYVCHKKCQDKCRSENPYCVAAGDRRSADPEAKSTINRATTGITRHIINTSSRLLSLRPLPKARLAEQVAELPGAGVIMAGACAVEPSPKDTPNTSDNESSDTETYTGASPSKHGMGVGVGVGMGGRGAKLARKEGGLDDSVFIAVKEIGRDLYRGLPTDERSQKLELMLDKLQQEIDQELEHNNALLHEEREASADARADARHKGLLAAALAKSGERLQALTLLMIHYRAGIEDLESVESTSPSEPHGFPKAKGLEEVLEEEDSLMVSEVYDSDICSPIDVMDDITDEQICVEALH